MPASPSTFPVTTGGFTNGARAGVSAWEDRWMIVSVVDTVCPGCDTVFPAVEHRNGRCPRCRRWVKRAVGARTGRCRILKRRGGRMEDWFCVNRGTPRVYVCRKSALEAIDGYLEAEAQATDCWMNGYPEAGAEVLGFATREGMTSWAKRRGLPMYRVGRRRGLPTMPKGSQTQKRLAEVRVEAHCVQVRCFGCLGHYTADVHADATCPHCGAAREAA